MVGGVFRSPAAPCLFWAGLSVAGAVTAVAKFRTGVPRPSLLKVGKEQFRALRNVEWVTAAAATVSSALGPANVRPAVILAIVVTSVQTFGTAPMLNSRADMAAAENAAAVPVKPKSKINAHSMHTILELIKLCACLAAASAAM
jgi:hypothetical protein